MYTRMDNSEKAREYHSLSRQNQETQEEPEVLCMGY